MTDTKLTIGFGRKTYPDDVRAVWGARLIWPNDLVYNRQDLATRDDEAKQELAAWLNGDPVGSGAIRQMIDTMSNIAKRYEIGLGSSADDNEVVIYEDEVGKLIGSAQASHGHLYVCAWLKEHAS